MKTLRLRTYVYILLILGIVPMSIGCSSMSKERGTLDDVLGIGNKVGTMAEKTKLLRKRTIDKDGKLREVAFISLRPGDNYYENGELGFALTSEENNNELPSQ